MKNLLFYAAAFLASLTCQAGKLKIVTTLPDLRSIAEMVAGDKAETFSIATGYQNPHFVDPKPSYIMKLTHADLFVTVGLDLETGWSPSLLASSRNAKIQKGSAGYVDASAGIALMQVPATAPRGTYTFTAIPITGSTPSTANKSPGTFTKGSSVSLRPTRPILPPTSKSSMRHWMQN
jgi:ABC-type Zn uptake system ZnuABC Zn-binding protein ZnuA